MTGSEGREQGAPWSRYLIEQRILGHSEGVLSESSVEVLASEEREQGDVLVHVAVRIPMEQVFPTRVIQRILETEDDPEQELLELRDRASTAGDLEAVVLVYRALLTREIVADRPAPVPYVLGLSQAVEDLAPEAEAEEAALRILDYYLPFARSDHAGPLEARVDRLRGRALDGSKLLERLRRVVLDSNRHDLQLRVVSGVDERGTTRRANAIRIRGRLPLGRALECIFVDVESVAHFATVPPEHSCFKTTDGNQAVFDCPSLLGRNRAGYAPGPAALILVSHDPSLDGSLPMLAEPIDLTRCSGTRPDGEELSRFQRFIDELEVFLAERGTEAQWFSWEQLRD